MSHRSCDVIVIEMKFEISMYGAADDVGFFHYVTYIIFHYSHMTIDVTFILQTANDKNNTVKQNDFEYKIVLRLYCFGGHSCDTDV